MMMSGTEAVNDISNIKIGAAQREPEQTPLEPILPPQPNGSYDVDESVLACEVGLPSRARTLLINVSFSCLRNKSHTSAELWHVTVGKNSQTHCRVALRRREELLPQGWITPAMMRYATADANLSGRNFRCHGEAHVRGRIRIPESHSRRFSWLRAGTLRLGEIYSGGS